MGKWLIPTVAVSLVITGCITSGPRCHLTISNSGDNPITDVDLEFSGVVKYSQPAVGPHSDGEYKTITETMPAASQIKWKDAQGNPVSKLVKMEKPIPNDFRGRVLYQIDNASEVKVFVMPETDDGTQLIPWGNSGNWDPTVMIPGFNQQ